MSKKSAYLLLKWIHENKFSVLRRDKICDLNLRNKPDRLLLNKVIDVLWSKKPYSAKILELGEKLDLKEKLKIYETPQKKRKEKDNDQDSTQLQVASVLRAIAEPETHDSIETNTASGSVSIIPEESVEYWKEKCIQEKARADKYKNKVKSLKAKLKLNDTKDEGIEIAPGVIVDRLAMDTIKTVSLSPTVFARNLMRAVFDDEELIGKSLFGRKCNANVHVLPKESIDAAKRDAVILETCKRYGCNSNEQSGRKNNEPILAKIHRTMGDYIREVSNKQQEKLMNV